MVSILCLAHYCDTHGPTPLMVTEALPVNCDSCEYIETETDSSSARRPSTTSSITARASKVDASSLVRENGGEQKRYRSQSSNIPILPTGIEPSLETPRASLSQNTQNHSCRRDSSFRKTYDENDKKRAIPCENCALTLPRKTNEEPTTPGQGSPEKRAHRSSPILRTRKPYERIVSPIQEPFPLKSEVYNSGESDTAVQGGERPLSKTPRRAKSSSSNSSFAFTIAHNHYLDYTSTHEPLAPASFSIIRQSCLRTLSCETLPPSSSSSSFSPTSPFISSPFFVPSSATSTSSGGPIFFGDPLAGYTTAYIFRIPDPTARGRRRVYALMALSTQRERLAMQTFSILSTAFRELAAWIQGLAEQELELSENVINSPRLGDNERSSSTTAFSGNSTPTTSFLSGRGRGSEGKFPGMNLRARGLAELVGLPDFFIELHARFVRLLIELGVMFGS